MISHSEVSTLGYDCPALHPQHKAGGQDQDIQDGNIFKPEGISQVHKKIDAQNKKELKTRIGQIYARTVPSSSNPMQMTMATDFFTLPEARGLFDFTGCFRSSSISR